MPDIPNLMAIGQFSSVTRISARMLRHYDAHGVLVPAHVDAITGYRSYTPDQLSDALMVRKLRDVGFGVSAIGALLAARDSPIFNDALEQQRDVLEGELRAAQHRLQLIDRMREAQEQENIMSKSLNIEIDEHPFAARRIVGLRGTIPNYQSEPQLWEQLGPQLEQQRIAATGPCGALNHDPEYKESDVDVEVWAEVAPDATANEPLRVNDLAELRALRATVSGSYDQISEACDQLLRRAQAEQLTIAGGIRYVYLNNATTTPTEQLRTEVYLPVR